VIDHRRLTRSAAVIAVEQAIAGGRVLTMGHHPDFGGALTVGPYRPAVGPQIWAVVHHGGSCDVGSECASSIEAARAFVLQVGKSAAWTAAQPMEDS
jgi:hypothetical protein